MWINAAVTEFEDTLAAAGVSEDVQAKVLALAGQGDIQGTIALLRAQGLPEELVTSVSGDLNQAKDAGFLQSFEDAAQRPAADYQDVVSQFEDTIDNTPPDELPTEPENNPSNETVQEPGSEGQTPEPGCEQVAPEPSGEQTTPEPGNEQVTPALGGDNGGSDNSQQPGSDYGGGQPTPGGGEDDSSGG
ncbi:MAG TPA: hypothetical protein VMT24_13980 [Aggregatilineaceae bacterium]|nr:hypothetical protein [Aggregatilineaceae bacterium]